jgi:hypothetical protein
MNVMDRALTKLLEDTRDAQEWFATHDVPAHTPVVFVVMIEHTRDDDAFGRTSVAVTDGKALSPEFLNMVRGQYAGAPDAEESVQ